MLALYIVQGALPLALIAWIAIAPQRSKVGFWSQAIATALGIYAVARLGVWLFPPWWTPYALVFLLVAAVVAGLRRRALATLWPTRLTGWGLLICFGALGLFVANETRMALGATRPPPGPSARLSSPLGPGRYMVANGGTTVALNAHADALDQSIAAHRPWHGTAYGIDLVAVDAFGLRADGIMPPDPSRYRIFGMPVVAPCTGRVIGAVDGLPDMQVPDFDRENLAGNHVILRCDRADIVLGHFKKGTVRVRSGDAVAVGTPVAQVGNSGGSSEPHLHIHAQRPGTTEAPFSGAPIPTFLEGRFLVRNDRFDGSGSK